MFVFFFSMYFPSDNNTEVFSRLWVQWFFSEDLSSCSTWEMYDTISISKGFTTSLDTHNKNSLKKIEKLNNVINRILVKSANWLILISRLNISLTLYWPQNVREAHTTTKDTIIIMDNTGETTRVWTWIKNVPTNHENYVRHGLLKILIWHVWRKCMKPLSMIFVYFWEYGIKKDWATHVLFPKYLLTVFTFYNYSILLLEFVGCPILINDTYFSQKSFRIKGTAFTNF